MDSLESDVKVEKVLDVIVEDVRCIQCDEDCPVKDYIERLRCNLEQHNNSKLKCEIKFPDKIKD